MKGELEGDVPGISMAQREAFPLKERMKMLEDDVVKLRGGNARLVDAVVGLKESLDHNSDMTADIHEIVQNFKGFSATVKIMGKTLMFLGQWLVTPFIFGAAVFYMLTHHGELPTWWPGFLKLFWE